MLLDASEESNKGEEEGKEGGGKKNLARNNDLIMDMENILKRMKSIVRGNEALSQAPKAHMPVLKFPEKTDGEEKEDECAV